MAEIFKVGFFWNVFSDELIRILNGPFLPRRIRIGEVYDDLFSSFPAHPFGDFKVCRELASVVGRYGFDGFPVWEQQPYYGPCRRQCLPPLRQLLHEYEVGGPFREREYGVSVGIHDGIHFPISEA